MKKLLSKTLSIFLVITGLGINCLGQRFLTGIDSSMFIRDSVRPLLERFGNLRFSGYIQSQYQVIGSDGAETYGGGNFAPDTRNRFMLRRARMKMDYLALTDDRLPKALFTFQIDATERTVRVRDMFVRLYETRGNNLSLTTGIFAKPFGYEVNVSSSFRETPERGRMSQILIPSERDLGVMLSFEPQKPGTNKHFLRLDLGVFNGPGLSAITDFDNKKDLTGRFTYRINFSKKVSLQTGVSGNWGGWKQATRYVYRTSIINNSKAFVVDSSVSNLGKTAPRRYLGLDAQFRIEQQNGNGLELRGEYWMGKQPGTAETTLNPGTLPTTPTYIRNFNGGFFYVVQEFGKKGHHIIIKYDWYDPNTDVEEALIGSVGGGFTAGDINYKTLGLGYGHTLSGNLRLTLYYEIVTNKATQLVDYSQDLKDNLLTCRLQFRF